MEGQQLRGAGGSKEEYHDIPNDSSGTPGKFKTGRVRQELPIFSELYEQMEVGLR